jgi:predicted ABC-type ATPase
MPATIYLIGGCNGAGKTTFARDFLPAEVKCLRFFNADEIARGLSPLDPSAGQIKAGRLLLQEVRASIEKRETFALESTLSGVTYVRLLRDARSLGYEIELHFLWLAATEQAVARVRQRVREGGHGVPEADIRRRFKRGLFHLVADYLALASRWIIWDNRNLPGKVLASSAMHGINEVTSILGCE